MGRMGWTGESVRGHAVPSPTLSPTDPVPRGLLTLCPWASSGPQGAYTAYMQPIYSLYAAYIQRCARLSTLPANVWICVYAGRISYAGLLVGCVWHTYVYMCGTRTCTQVAHIHVHRWHTHSYIGGTHTPT